MIRKEKRRKEDKANVGGLFPSAVAYAIDTHKARPTPRPTSSTLQLICATLEEPAPERNEFTFKKGFKKEGHVYWGYMTAARMEASPTLPNPGALPTPLQALPLTLIIPHPRFPHGRIGSA